MANTTTSSGVNERVRDAKVATYRDLILDVAEQEFARQGYELTHMKVVAGSAGMSLATLYAHFPTKMDLYRAVHGRRLASLAQALAAGAPRSSDPLDQMLGAMRVYVTFHMSHPTWLCMHLREGNTWTGDDRLRSPEQTAAWNRGIRSMAKTFRSGVAAGIFADDDPLLMAQMTNAMHQVALSRWVDEGMVEAPEPVLERMLRRFVRAFCVPERVPALLAARGLAGRS